MRYIHYAIWFFIFLLLVDIITCRNRNKCCSGRKKNKRHKKRLMSAESHSKIGKNVTLTADEDMILKAKLISFQMENNNRRIALERYKALLQSRKGKLPSLTINRNKTNKWTEAIVKIALKVDDKIHEGNASGEINIYRLPITETIGKFGYHSNQDAVSGKIIHIVDKGNEGTHFGCTGDIANSAEIVYDEPWIALVSRGKCRFLDKIKLAEKFGASAVVVYDNDPSGNVEVMRTIGTKITSLMINSYDGTTLAQLINKGQEIYVDISVGETHIKPAGSASAGNRVHCRYCAHSYAAVFLTIVLQTVLIRRL